MLWSGGGGGRRICQDDGQTEDRARETQAVLISGQKVTRVDSARRDCSSPLVFYTN